MFSLFDECFTGTTYTSTESTTFESRTEDITQTKTPESALTLITWTFNTTQSSTLKVTTTESTVERNLIIITVLIVIILIICVIIGLIMSQKRHKKKIFPLKTQTYTRDSEMTRISSGFQSFI